MKYSEANQAICYTALCCFIFLLLKHTSVMITILFVLFKTINEASWLDSVSPWRDVSLYCFNFFCKCMTWKTHTHQCNVYKDYHILLEYNIIIEYFYNTVHYTNECRILEHNKYYNTADLGSRKRMMKILKTKIKTDSQTWWKHTNRFGQSVLFSESSSQHTLKSFQKHYLAYEPFC